MSTECEQNRTQGTLRFCAVWLAAVAGVAASKGAEPSERVLDAAIRVVAAPEVDEPARLPAVGDSASPSRPRAVAGVVGTTVAGRIVTLSGDGSEGSPTHDRWVQVDGPPVGLRDATRSNARFEAPAAGGTPVFALSVANASGVDVAIVRVPIEGRAAGGEAEGERGGVVGRQVTLEAKRLSDRRAVRWLQVAGPKVRLKVADGARLAFIPEHIGNYRFAAIAVSGDTVSEPEFHNVEVSESAGGATKAPAPSSLSLEDEARARLRGLNATPEASARLADALEAVAVKADVYESYAVLFEELSRRLDDVVPGEPTARAEWLGRLFDPLTVRLIEEMRGAGIELRTPEGRASTLSPAQRTRIGESFHRIARGFRAAGETR